MDNEMPSVKCGCGFTATSPDPAANNQAFELHTCFEGDAPASSWWSAIFSFDGIIVMVVVGWVLVEIVKALKG